MTDDRLRIRGLQVDCIVGVYPHERTVLQPLTVDVEMRLPTRDAGEHERLASSIDYENVAAQIVFVLRFGRFRLLETAAHTVAKVLLAPPAPGEARAPLRSLKLQLTKHHALQGRGEPSIEIEREAGFASSGRETKPFGTVDIFHETQDVGVYRLNVEPGGTIARHVHQQMDEAEMVLTDGLHVQGRPVAPLSVHRWPHGAPHAYENPSERVQSVLCIDSPPFVEADEVPSSGELAAVPTEDVWGRPFGATS